jgi:molybdopterin-containing oxidoreductase family iron-sulfur binding subunit
VALVTGRITSPTTLSCIERLKVRFPNLLHYRYEAIHDDAARAGSRLAFGRVFSSLPRWADADVVLCLGADPLGPGPDQLRIARDYASRRERRQRLHVAESAWTLTGAAADFREPLSPVALTEIARSIAGSLGADVGVASLSPEADRFARRAVRDLMAAKGRALVLAGACMPPEAHALCHWINDALGAPVDFVASPDPVEEDHAASLARLGTDLAAGRVGAVIAADANPVYDAPDALNLAQAIGAAPFSVHLGVYCDETGAACQWHLPLSHVLESWGDARACDGTASLVQPLIRRLYDTRTLDEAFAYLSGERSAKAYDLVRATWRPQTSGEFEPWWRDALGNGVLSGTASIKLAARTRLSALAAPSPAPDLVLSLAPDPSVWDGRFANIAWLQECAKPFTRQVWGNAIEISPHDAERLGVAEGDTVDIAVGRRTVTAALAVAAGQANGVLRTTLGFGRAAAGRIGNDIGTQFANLATQPLESTIPIDSLRKSEKIVPLRSTQRHSRLAGRTEDLFPVAMAAPAARRTPKGSPPSLLAIPPRGEYAWAMVIDADACIGCNACVVACQAENNVPVVGPEEIDRGRDMHWLRVDGYEMDGGALRGFQPVPCMHCELAPCEPVCPVEASVHDRGGLNVQVYNRCIGTRFCEANCPYKVRRFNWFDYAGDQSYAAQGAALKAQHNPDVSVRPRGVMEKCNYCLQRISRARRTAEKEDREIAEGEMVTACQAACPTRAIHFGNLDNEESDVSRLRKDPRHYTLLAGLNTRPRTTYLERVYNRDDEPE